MGRSSRQQATQQTGAGSAQWPNGGGDHFMGLLEAVAANRRPASCTGFRRAAWDGTQHRGGAHLSTTPHEVESDSEPEQRGPPRPCGDDGHAPIPEHADSCTSQRRDSRRLWRPHLQITQTRARAKGGTAEGSGGHTCRSRRWTRRHRHRRASSSQWHTTRCRRHGGAEGTSCGRRKVLRGRGAAHTSEKRAQRLIQELQKRTISDLQLE